MPGAFELADAVAGELRKVGIRSTVDRRTMATYRKKQGDGQIQALVAIFSSGGFPDASALLGFYFDGSGRDYYRDKELTEWTNLGERTVDPEKRKEIYRKAFDRLNEKAYVLPVANKPTLWLHTKEVKVIPGSLAPMGGEPAMVHWN
jgi:peptide/nickel transport system substrate-binding protein